MTSATNHPQSRGPGPIADALDAAKLPIEAERLAAEIVASHLDDLLAGGEGAPHVWSRVIAPVYLRWLQSTLQYLGQQGHVEIDSATQRCRFPSVEPVEALWRRWEANHSGSRNSADHRAYLALIEACLRKLPQILTGAVPATDVMFPESSMDLVEGIYKHNSVADHFNQVLADSLRKALAGKVASGERDLRLLEIGAGTGGTTASLLPMLRELGGAIREYRYTDLSKAFLLHAEENYKPLLPVLQTAIFDVSKPLAGQAIVPNRYDAVIATNVLHATPNMRETLRNAKAVLKRGGLLLINEISEWSWYTHFTFGLLEGWWLYEDEGLRLPGSPALSPTQWQDLLRAEGFSGVHFPAQGSHGLGQQIIVATSDGVIRQRRSTNAIRKKPAALTRPVTAPVGQAVAADDSTLRERAVTLFRSVIASALKMDAREIEPNKALEHYGLDSILVVQLTTHLRKLFPNVRSTLFFEVQSVDGLVAHFIANDRATLMSVLAAQSAPSTAPALPERAVSGERRRFAARRNPSPIPPKVEPTRSQVDVAVVGVSGRYPKARDLDQFWENLASGRNCADEVPAERWQWQHYFDPEKGKPGKIYSKWGGFLDDIDRFDPLFFKIAPKEAKRIDPQERLFLETSYHAIEDSGYTPGSLAADGKVGVFVGVMNSRYTVQPLYYSIANRVSYLFNFSGPSLAVDTACSSSLTAIHLALESLYGGMCEVAIAGGVNLILDPQHMLELSAVGMLSESSQCRSFGKNADGFVDAEGVGAVILKPLANAVRDGDNIYAVIKGSALNAGGRTHGYTVPNPLAQADVVSQALARASIDAADVSYIEAHGTGTALGDPIEIAGLTKAFHASRGAAASRKTQYCAIGSLKSNIGHCESAAGIAGLTKILLQLKHRQLVPTLHSEVVNDEIDFSTTPFSLQRELAPWRRFIVSDDTGTREVPRIAGISSFGAGGANAHVVMQEYHEPKSESVERRGSWIVPLSARTAEQLQQKVRQLHAFLVRHGSRIELGELAYTLQVGREAMAERLVVLPNSIEDLQRQLAALSAGTPTEGAVYRRAVKQRTTLTPAHKADPELSELMDRWVEQRNDAKIAEYWIDGVDLDWIKLYPGRRPRRISLPLYPFARERHWIEPQRAGGSVQTSAPVHPLLQRNASTLRGPIFSSNLKGDEAFIVEGPAGQRSLPALLCMEMARAAVSAAYPEDVTTRDLCFNDVVWGEAILVDTACELHVALLADDEHTLRFEIFSTREGQELVHCQGRVRLEPKAEPVHADIAAMQRMSRSHREVLLEFSNTGQSASAEQWHLSPAVVDCLMRGVARLLAVPGGESSVPVGLTVDELGALRLDGRCGSSGYIVLRCVDAVAGDNTESQWEVEIYDSLGKLCCHANGLRIQGASQADGKEEVAQLPIPMSLAATKPNRVALGAVDDGAIATNSKRDGLATIALTELGTHLNADALGSHVTLHEHGEGLFSIAIGHALLDASVQEQLRQTLHAVQQKSDAKALLITGLDSEFLHGVRDSVDRAIDTGLYQAVLDFPLPTIAVMQGNASGAGFLLAALCDFVVASRESHYVFSDPQQGFYPTQAESELFAARFGDAWADDLLYINGSQSGQAMSNKGWSLPIVARAEVMPTAWALAKNIAAKSPDSLRLLKQHFAAKLQVHVARLVASQLAQRVEVVTLTEERLQLLGPESLRVWDGVTIGKPSDAVVTLCLLDSDHGLSQSALLRNLQGAVEELAQFSGYQSLIICSEYRQFLPDGDADNEQINSLLAVLAAFPAPVIVAFEADATGPAWLLGLGADVCIYADRGKYSTDMLWRDPALLEQATPLLHRRLGERLAKQVLFAKDGVSGSELASGCATVVSAASGQVLAQAQRLAASSPLLSPVVLRQWRERKLVRDRAEECIRAFSAVALGATEQAPFVPSSRAVELEAHDNGVVVVRMIDRDAKNMFSADLIRGLEEVFAHIEASNDYRVVVLCGYDTYFACGGTKESLLAIQQGKARFTDTKIYQLPMSCKLPVIAAMQGHAIGGGWALGMFADVCCFSAESHYISPYMQYGFTPGAGSTLIFPATLGTDLAKETLFTATEYTGSALQAKGLPHRCLARSELMPHALALANTLAARPRESMLALKRYFSSRWLRTLEETYERELTMHEKSFVGRQDALRGINENFGAGDKAFDAPVLAPAPSPEASASGMAQDLKIMLAAELQMNVDDLDENAQFVDLGLDSITGVTWVRKINASYGTKIEATKVYSYPTLAEFSRYVGTLASAPATSQCVEVRVSQPAVADKPVSVATPPRSDAKRPKVTSWRKQSSPRRALPGSGTDAIAVIGIAGQFPRARNLEEFWRNIAGGKDCIDPVPPQRWNIDDYFNADISVPGTTNSRWMGVLDDCDAFDPLFFNISPTEAESMDPQQRVLLQSCWHAIENAAVNPRALSGSRCGVFIGCGPTDYHQRSREHQYSAQGFTGASMSILAARISYFLNLQGPCLSIDTACSSSLVAIANACDSLIAHNCDSALAGGVALMAGPTMHIKTAQAGMLSVDGKCFAFDQRANGFVPGEGVGVVMLKRQADAVRDGDIIHATIRGWGVNQDGKTNGITAPNPISQARLMRAIYDRFGIDPEDIQLIEAHGTGTKLGDPIEVEGLTEAFRHYTQKSQYCTLGSIKSNIGHCLYAAGVASVLKLVLALKRQQLPPAANFQRLNEHIDLTNSPFVIDTELKPWAVNKKGSRLAGVSSFGFSGTNAHLVLELPEDLSMPARPDIAPSQPMMIPLSAKTAEQLRQKAQDLASFIERSDSSLSLADVAYTLQVGRDVMDERCATVVSSKQELVERLHAFAAGTSKNGVYVGDVSSRASKLALLQQDGELRDALVEKCIQDGKLGQLMQLWVDGLELVWDRLPQRAAVRRRIELPLYPFAKERYWLADDRLSISGTTSAIHPLLQVNTSTLSGQRYRTTFRGDEAYLRDHRVRLAGGHVERVLPGVAYLEMALAAVADALPERAASQRLALNNVAWWRPVSVNGPTAVAVELGVDEDGVISYEIVSDSDGERVVHCQGEADFVEDGATPQVDTAAFERALNGAGWRADEIYAAFSQVGLHYGPAHRAVERLCSADGRVIAKVVLPSCASGDSAAYRLHPSVMDGALQACIGFLPSLQSLPRAPSVPFTMQSLRLWAPCPPQAFVALTPTRKDICDVFVYAPDGRLCVEIRGFARRAVDAQKSGPSQTTVFDEAFYQELLAGIANRTVLAEEAVELE